MKSAILIIDVSKRVNVFDYVAKVKPIMENISKYDVVYCLLNDLIVDETTISVFDKSKLVYENIQTLLNLGLDNKVKYILQSKIDGIYELSNEISKYIYISKIIKNDYLKSSIQKNSLNDIKLSSLINITNIISSILLLQADDLYETKNFETLYSYMQKVLAVYNESNDKKLFLPKLVLNNAFLYNNLSTDGNSFISDKFDNDISLCLTDDELKTKINGIYTDPNHIKVQDKGNVGNNPLFAFVDAICENSDVKEFFNLESIEELKKNYTNGGIGDYKVKQMLFSAFVKRFGCCRNVINEDILKNKIS